MVYNYSSGIFWSEVTVIFHERAHDVGITNVGLDECKKAVVFSLHIFREGFKAAVITHLVDHDEAEIWKVAVSFHEGVYHFASSEPCAPGEQYTLPNQFLMQGFHLFLKKLRN